MLLLTFLLYLGQSSWDGCEWNWGAVVIPLSYIEINKSSLCHSFHQHSARHFVELGFAQDSASIIDHKYKSKLVKRVFPKNYSVKKIHIVDLIVAEWVKHCQTSISSAYIINKDHLFGVCFMWCKVMSWLQNWDEKYNVFSQIQITLLQFFATAVHENGIVLQFFINAKG